MPFHAFGVGEGEGICISLESMLPLSETMTPLENDVSGRAGRC